MPIDVNGKVVKWDYPTNCLFLLPIAFYLTQHAVILYTGNTIFKKGYAETKLKHRSVLVFTNLELIFCLTLLTGCAHDPQSVSFWGYPSLPAAEYLVRAKEILYINGDKPPLKNSLDDPDTNQAKKLLELYLKSFPNDSEAINLYAVVLKIKGLIKESEDQFQKAILIQPQNAAYRFNLYNLYLDAQRNDEAIIGYRYLIDQNNNVASFHLNLAKACENKKDEPCAREHFQIASELDPTDRFAQEKANAYSAR